MLKERVLGEIGGLQALMQGFPNYVGRYQPAYALSLINCGFNSTIGAMIHKFLY